MTGEEAKRGLDGGMGRLHAAWRRGVSQGFDLGDGGERRGKGPFGEGALRGEREKDEW